MAVASVWPNAFGRAMRCPVAGVMECYIIPYLREHLLDVMPLPTLRHLLDRFGATGSLLCAVHCAALPLLLALAPSLGVSFWLGDRVEVSIVVFVTLLGLSSLVLGYLRHKAMHALALLLPGLALLWLGLLYDPLHHSTVPHAVVMTLGGTLVGIAHLVNLRLNHGHVHDASCAH